MSFFDSEVVRAEMAEVSELQEEVYNNVFKFPSMSKEDKKYQPVIDMLNIGINNCCIWNKSMLNKHFVQVYRTIQHCK